MGGAASAIAGALNAGTTPATFTDDFVRGSENPLSKGGAWTSGVTGTGNLQVVLSGICGGTTGNSFQFCNTPTFTANQKSTVTIGANTGGIGCIVRAASNGNAYLLYQGGSTVLSLYKVTGGSGLSQIGSDYAITATSTGDTISLGIVGTTLTLYRNGVAQSPTQTDATWATGQPGAFSNLATSTITFVSFTDI